MLCMVERSCHLSQLPIGRGFSRSVLCFEPHARQPVRPEPSKKPVSLRWLERAHCSLLAPATFSPLEASTPSAPPPLQIPLPNSHGTFAVCRGLVPALPTQETPCPPAQGKGQVLQVTDANHERSGTAAGQTQTRASRLLGRPAFGREPLTTSVWGAAG